MYVLCDCIAPNCEWMCWARLDSERLKRMRGNVIEIEHAKGMEFSCPKFWWDSIESVVCKIKRLLQPHWFIILAKSRLLPHSLKRHISNIDHWRNYRWTKNAIFMSGTKHKRHENTYSKVNTYSAYLWKCFAATAIFSIRYQCCCLLYDTSIRIWQYFKAITFN